VAETLAGVDRSRWGGKPSPGRDEDHGAYRFPGNRKTDTGAKAFAVAEPTPAFTAPATDRPARSDLSAAISPSLGESAAKPREAARQTDLWPRQRFADLKIIGQFWETYLLCEAGEDLIVIDQHAAHERIMYEQLQQRAQGERPATQGLLVPETIELGFRESALLTAMLPDLNRLGLEIEPFSGNTFAVKAVPALLGQGSVERLILEIVEKMADIGFAPGLEKAFDECRHLIACHGAIRANQSLSHQEIRRLLVQLDACEHPSNCPHGRPTWIKYNKKFFEKAFGRTK
jgi:DNA mismatch repair protein MutL